MESEDAHRLQYIVELDHCYCKPLARHDQKEKAISLFLKPVIRCPGETSSYINPYEWVDVEGNGESRDEAMSIAPDPYVDSAELALQFLLGTEQATSLPTVDNETEDGEDTVDVEAKVEPWRLVMQTALVNRRLKINEALVNKIVGVLEGDRMAQMAIFKPNIRKTKEEEVTRQLQIEKLSRKIRSAFAGAKWKMDACALVHACLLEHLPSDLLSCYIDGFRELISQKKLNYLIAELNRLTKNLAYVKRFHVEQFFKLIRQTRDGFSVKTNIDLSWPSGTPRPVTLLLSYPLSQKSRRLMRFHQLLSSFSMVLTLKPDEETNMPMKNRLNIIKRRLLHEVSTKQPIFVVCWGAGSLLAMIALLQLCRNPTNVPYERIVNLVCLGMPVRGLRGSRGHVDDPLLGVRVPALLVTGGNSLLAPPDELELFRERFRQPVRMVTVGGCDHLLRMTRRWKSIYGVTQEMVDRSIAKEIMSFVWSRVRESPNTERVDEASGGLDSSSGHLMLSNSPSTHRRGNSGSSSSRSTYRSHLETPWPGAHRPWRSDRGAYPRRSGQTRGNVTSQGHSRMPQHANRDQRIGLPMGSVRSPRGGMLRGRGYSGLGGPGNTFSASGRARYHGYAGFGNVNSRLRGTYSSRYSRGVGQTRARGSVPSYPYHGFQQRMPYHGGMLSRGAAHASGPSEQQQDPGRSELEQAISSIIERG